MSAILGGGAPNQNRWKCLVVVFFCDFTGFGREWFTVEWTRILGVFWARVGVSSLLWCGVLSLYPHLLSGKLKSGLSLQIFHEAGTSPISKKKPFSTPLLYSYARLDSMKLTSVNKCACTVTSTGSHKGLWSWAFLVCMLEQLDHMMWGANYEPAWGIFLMWLQIFCTCALLWVVLKKWFSVGMLLPLWLAPLKDWFKVSGIRITHHSRIYYMMDFGEKESKSAGESSAYCR